LSMCMLSLQAFAQEMGTAPKAEIFGGYQYTRFDGGVNANGWNTALAGNLNNWFGIAADFGGAYKSLNGASFNTYTYTFGPVVSFFSCRVVSRAVHIQRARPAVDLPQAVALMDHVVSDLAIFSCLRVESPPSITVSALSRDTWIV